MINISLKSLIKTTSSLRNLLLNKTKSFIVLLITLISFVSIIIGIEIINPETFENLKPSHIKNQIYLNFERAHNCTNTAEKTETFMDIVKCSEIASIS